MKKKIIGILDREYGYALKLRDIFNGRNRTGFQAEMFTGTDTYLEYTIKNPVEILLIGESLMENALKHTAELIVVISEGIHVAEEEELPIVYKYQSAELIINKVLEYYAAVGSGSELICRAGARIYGVYAPQGRSCKSAFAWNLAKHLGQDKTILYMGLNAFHDKEELYNGNKDLADIMYYVRNGFDNLIYLVGSSVVSYEGIDCLPAIQSVDDLLHVPCEDWLKLLQIICLQSNYDALVLDMEECVQQFYRILDYCTEVYMPYQEQYRSEVKWNMCKHFFKKVGAEEVWTKSRKLVVNSNNWTNDTESILIG